MTLAEIQRLLKCQVFGGEECLSRKVKYGCASDLMSDVLAFSRAGSLLLTGLATIQTVQTAFIAEISAIVFVRGRKPDQAMIALAQQQGIPLLGTPYSMYEACGILYRSGITSTIECLLPEASSRNA